MKTKKMNMGGRTGDMMYSRGYGVGNKGKRVPTELMTAPGMKKGGKVKKDDDVSDMVKPGGTRFFDSDEVRDAKRKADKKNKKRIDKQRKELGYKAGGKVKKQGYNARLDDSLGARKGKKKQSMKARRDESKGMKKSAGKKAYSGNRKSAQGSASKRADGIARKGRTKGRMV